MAGALRCSMCAIDWPVLRGNDGYSECPQCGERTDYINEGDPLDVIDARGMKRQAQFEAWCERNGRT